MIIWYFTQDTFSQPTVFSCKHCHSPTSVSARLHAAQQSKTLLYQLLRGGKTVPRPAFIYRGSNKLIFLPSLLRCTPLVTAPDCPIYFRCALISPPGQDHTLYNPQPSSASPTNCHWIKNVSVAVKVQFKIRSLLAGYTGYWGSAATCSGDTFYPYKPLGEKIPHTFHAFLVVAEADMTSVWHNWQM